MNPQDAKVRLKKLGAFEISDEMQKLAAHNEKGNVYLDAGRGNPNWINTKARLAFARLMAFGVAQAQLTIADGDLAGYTTLPGIAQRLADYLDPTNNEVDAFIGAAVAYGVSKFGFDEDAFVKELTDGVLGTSYPGPNRVLHHTEKILNAYLEATLYNEVKLAEQTQVFPTEGGTAAIVYLFNSLKENHLLAKGDKIAIHTPIFTPYLQIPDLNDYALETVNIQSSAENNWEMDPTELAKLLDPTIKALFLVNPSNPGAMALDQEALAHIQQLVAVRPDLIIITDDVYGSFVNNFQSVYTVAPHNTLLVYSYSKLFGATGWRLGLIAMHEDNVCDRLITQLPAADQADLVARYTINAAEPTKMPFVERIVADSRSVGLYHTAGLSTPQQIMEALFSLTYLVHTGAVDAYVEASKKLVGQRYDNLLTQLALPKNDSPYNSKYYALIDIFDLAQRQYGAEFRAAFERDFDQIDFLYKLSHNNGVVLMDGVGFGSHVGILRVSQANLPNEAYTQVAHQILALVAEYHHAFEQTLILK